MRAPTHRALGIRRRLGIHGLVPVALLAMLVLGRVVALAAEPRHPNVIVFLVDDLGATDLGCDGSTFHQTPHIDQLAREGTRFTEAYSACTVCSPTRASLLTGKYPARLHVTDWIPGDSPKDRPLVSPAWTEHLPLEEWNLARAFRGAGYATISIGKWHLGGAEFYPDRQGFDRNVGGTDRGQPPSYFSPYKIPTLPDGPPGEFLPDRESAEACRFIRENRTRPFFLYLASYAVHQPIAGKSNVVAKYRLRADPAAPQHNAVYAALLEGVDDSVGEIRSTLADCGLTRDTILVFTSDNGGLALGGASAPTSNRPLRAGKGTPYEGGVRVPLLVAWPGTIPAGRTAAFPTITPDLYPTLLELAGVPDSPAHTVDGVSLASLLRGGPPPHRPAIYWHYPHYHSGGATPYGAMRSGNWKWIEYDEPGRSPELYDLGRDPGESTNRAAQDPDVAKQLSADLAAWRERVGAQPPRPNPNAVPAPR
ncbi:MAG: sulfatase [Verrucomicrobiales bacterium]|nr:sulfatase [Verrucomicrobiales bacterium]